MSKILIKKSKYYFYRCPHCTRTGAYIQQYLKGVPLSCQYCGKLFHVS